MVFRVLLVQHKLPELRAIVQLEGEPNISDKRRLHKTHKVRLIGKASRILIFLKLVHKLDFY